MREEVTIWERRDIIVNLNNLDPNDRHHDWMRSAKAQLEHATRRTIDDWIGLDEESGEPNNEFYNIEYIIGSDGKYKHVILLDACGGPSCYLYTASCEYHLCWAGTRWYVMIDRDICEAINEHFEQYFECLK